MSILLIDNYDSFTYNLYHYLMEIGTDVSVVRNDAISIEDIRQAKPAGILLSPGPCTPNEAGICLAVVEELHKEFPIFGVCLGHQSIAQVFSGNVIRGDRPMHAQVSPIYHEGHPLFKNIPSPFNATRYHSLIVEDGTMSDEMEVIARSDDKVIQAIAHKKYPVFGVQFHPESIASDFGHTLLKNFLDISKSKA